MVKPLPFLARLALAAVVALLTSFASSAQNLQALSGKKALFLIAEREYGTVDSLPRFAREQLEPLGMKSSFVFAKSDDRDSELCHTFEGLEALDDADVLVLSSRRRYPLAKDLKRIREWIESGKPVVAIRTSSHAFGERAKGNGYQAPEGHAAWNTFDRDVLGAKYLGHYRDQKEGSDDAVQAWPMAAKIDHPILDGFTIGDLFEIDDKLYQYEDLDPEVEVLVSGRYPNENAIQHVAWVNEKAGKRVFYTSLGTVGEMKLPEVQHLLVQAITWAVAGAEKPRVANPVTPTDKIAKGKPRSATETMQSLVASNGLAIDLIVSEPIMAQPSYLNFDERGRMWVVQYRQYPFPAGVVLQSKDKFWRTQYNEIPAPPGHPNYVPGADTITIHEDTNGDGSYDKVTPFLEGLNMVTSLAWDRDGVWVLQPPYLLYYYDRDRDDQVEGPPEVRLSGFGIEDTHSTVNSLCWGPDGWLYGAQGSTVTASIEVAGVEGPPIKSIGQLMWRYHPETLRYEVFSEGGGNIWSCEFDSKGRLFAGANEGRKLGYHYMQGSYNKKNFGKHGDLSNSYAFGYFLGVEEPSSQRVTTNMMIYEEGALPSQYEASIFTANPLAGKVFASRKVPVGPSFHAAYLDTVFTAQDRWVRPVYLETGPDGAIYVADWYDRQVNHYMNSEGEISKVDGRIYRIRPEGDFQGVKVDLRHFSSNELVDTLADERRWYRETARRLLRERQDRSVLPRLRKLIETEKGQLALEALWAANLLGGLDASLRLKGLSHANPWVRIWTIRLIGDEERATPEEVSQMVALASADRHIEVRQQLASTAQRLPARDAVDIVAELLRRDEDASDPYMPLLVWWALEKASGKDTETVVQMFDENSDLFRRPMSLELILGFTMRRFATEGTRESLKLCARLLALAPGKEAADAMLVGFEESFRGRSMVGLPDALVDEIARSGGGSLAMRVRQGSAEALVEAKRALKGNSIKEEMRRRLIESLGESPQSEMLDSLVDQLGRDDEATLMVTLSALQAYHSPVVAAKTIELYPKFSDKIKTAAQTMLTSRLSWSKQWVEAIAQGKIAPSDVPDYALAGLRRHKDPSLNGMIARLWPERERSETMVAQEIAKLREIVDDGVSGGDPYSGRDLYLGRCSACHSLHSEGGDVGPELTGYQRHDLESLLLAISDPNAEIREGFENYTVTTVDGQTITGFLSDQDENVIVLRPIGGQKIVLDRERIQSMESAGVSLMPTGLLAGLENQSILDLFAYLRSTQPLNVRLP